jgi:ketosteroid isomerase-like protein
MNKIETFEALQKAVAKGDPEAIGAYLADDFILHEPPALPFGGDYLGPDGYLTLVRALQTTFELEVLSSRQTEARDDLLLCELVVRFISRKTGENAEMNLVDLYHYDASGKIRRVDGFYMDPDTIAAIALGRSRPERTVATA